MGLPGAASGQRSRGADRLEPRVPSPSQPILCQMGASAPAALDGALQNTMAWTPEKPGRDFGLSWGSLRQMARLDELPTSCPGPVLDPSAAATDLPPG